MLRKRSDEELDDERALAIEDDADTPEVVAQKGDKAALIRACMSRLSDEHREVVDLVYYHEKSIKEVSEIVGIPENTVKTRMFHARKKLSELMAQGGRGQRMAVMTDNDLKNPSPGEEIEMLLPWYVTGKISDDDRARVDRYLADHPEVQSQLALVREEIEETGAMAEALGSPRAGALDKLLADIEALDGPAIARAEAPSLAERLSAWLPSFESPAMQFAGIAAAIVIVAQAIVIGTLVGGGNGGGAQYETATGSETVVRPGTRLLVAFEPGATAEAITALLDEKNAAIVSGPKGSGLFEIRISEQQLDDAAIDLAIADFKARSGVVRFVAKTQ